MNDLAAPAATVTQLRQQIEDLGNQLNGGSDVYVSHRPVIQSVYDGEDIPRCRALEDKLIDAVQREHPAQLHVMINTFGEQHQIWVDFDSNNFSVMWQGQERTVAISKLETFWLESGHRT